VRAREHPYQTFMPWRWNTPYMTRGNAEEQVKENFECIDEQTRYIVHGSHRCPYDKAPARYRRNLNHTRKAKERNIMAKIRQGDYDLDVPKFKNDAAYDYW
jgi:hypothetical protein